MSFILSSKKRVVVESVKYQDIKMHHTTVVFVKNIAETIKSFTEIAAILIGGGCLWYYKWRAGYEVVNLSLDLQCQRTPQDDDTDLLVLSLTLNKGDRATLDVHDVQARFTIREKVKVVPFIGFERSTYYTDKLPVSGACPIERRVIDWTKRAETSPFLRLTPGESTCISIIYPDKLPKTETCFIEVAVLGKQASGKTGGQWKATCVSVPR